MKILNFSASLDVIKSGVGEIANAFGINRKRQLGYNYSHQQIRKAYFIRRVRKIC